MREMSVLYTYCWECGKFARIRSVPLGGDDLRLRVWRHLQRVGSHVHATLFDILDLLPDAYIQQQLLV